MSNETLLLKLPDVAARLSLSRSTIYELIQAGTLPVVRIGRAVRVPARAIREYAERLEAEQEAMAEHKAGLSKRFEAGEDAVRWLSSDDD